MAVGSGSAARRVVVVSGTTDRLISTDHRPPFKAWQLVCQVIAPALALALGHDQAAAQAQDQASATKSLDSVLVTARRGESLQSETPQKIDIITREQLDNGVFFELTDALKKNSSVDVIQYNGTLSGIGIRGFRPEFSGINKRTLLLIDGRPSGVTNLATVLLDNIDRIEVQKGPASALYGPSAMGGVVNVITRRNRGAVSGNVGLGVGSFGATDVSANAAGAINNDTYFSLSARRYEQRGDIKSGSGTSLPSSGFLTETLLGRLGYDFSSRWNLEVNADLYRAPYAENPGDIFFNQQGQSTKDLDRHSADVRLTGKFENNLLTALAYTSHERANTVRITSTTAADRPFLPFRSFESQVSYSGFQLRNDWAWLNSHSLLAGIDVEKAKSVGLSFNRNGQRLGPFSADNQRNTTGVFADVTLRFFGGQTVAVAGLRHDRIVVETLDTPFKTGFVPSRLPFNRTSPSLGFKQQLAPDVRLHATLGKGFVTPDGGQLTGEFSQVIGGKTTLTRGNPNLKPESSVAWDIGVEWLTPDVRLDFTYFENRVRDRIVSTTQVQANPLPNINSFANADQARMRGLELDGLWQATPAIGLTLNANMYLQRNQTVKGVLLDIYNVPKYTVRAGVNTRLGPLSGTLSLRHVGPQKDNDFNAAGTPEINYPTFTVADASVRYAIDTKQQIRLDVNNILNKLYFEKLGFPLSGRSFMLRYRYAF